MIPPLKFLCVMFCLIWSKAQAHEFWIEPEAYHLSVGDPFQAHFRVGQNFMGPSYSYLPTRSVRFDRFIAGDTAALSAVAGDTPAIQIENPPEGLLVLIHETTDASLTYREQGKFDTFVAHKSLDTSGLSFEIPFKELYRRYAKSLVGIGHGQGADQFQGLAHELVALTNPYTDDLSAGFLVQLIYQGAPQADAQIELFEKSPEDEVHISLHKTDESGRVLLPVTPGHSYLVDAVVLELHDPALGAEWYSHWASLTFAVPSCCVTGADSLDQD